MSHEQYHRLYKNYKKWAYVDPKPEETPSPVQLSVLAVILLSRTCYVDLALWGAFQGRAARAMRCVGMVPGPDNTWVHVDFKGPPDFACWRICFVVYVVAMIMLEQVLPPWLWAYVDFIAEFNTLYGPGNWAFLYQTDVRFRSEHMPAMAMRESDRLEDAMQRGSTTEYDSDKPWDFLWKLAASRDESQESRWWYREFERKCTPATAVTSRLIDGDARIATSPANHFASSHNPVNMNERGNGAPAGGGGAPGGGGKKPRGGGGKGDGKVPKASPAAVISTVPLTKTSSTKKAKTLCQGYNAGSCTGADGKECPHDKRNKHLCHWCLGNHSAIACRKNQQRQNTSGKGSGK